MPRFKIGTDDFKELITDNGYFVDKSLLIKAVIEGSKATLLPRPRRFGKTLNMTMLRYFFEHSDTNHRDLYQSLNIGQCADCLAHQGQYPVIYITLKDIKGETWSVAGKKLIERIADLYKQFAYISDSLAPDHQADFHRLANQNAKLSDYELSLKKLISYLYHYHNKPLVVLIDEYDSPIIEAWHYNYSLKMINFMRHWLGSALKHEHSATIYRAVVTGILRVAKESVFSGLNNLDVPSILEIGPFADKFGFTQKDIEQILLDFSLPGLEQSLQTWYNGYHFGGQTIYNPWSVSNFIHKQPNLPNAYWLNTASNHLIEAELEAGGFELKRDLKKLLLGEELRYAINENTVVDEIGKAKENIWSFLVLSGYLKAEAPEPDLLTQDLKYRLSIPNQEVKKVYRDFINQWHKKMPFNHTDELLQRLINAEFDAFEHLLQDLVSKLFSYHDSSHYPEAVYHAFVLGLIANLSTAYTIKSNPESGYGRADIIMQPNTVEYPYAFIIEFKAIKAEAKAETLVKTAQQALLQIEEKAYATQLLAADILPHHIYELAIVIHGKRVKMLAKKLASS